MKWARRLRLYHRREELRSMLVGEVVKCGGERRSTQNVLQSPLRDEGILVDDLCANHFGLLSSAFEMGP